MTYSPEKILVIRNDKLGDFMLAYPCFAVLKNSLPDTEITALVPEYTRKMAELCPWIDSIIIDQGRGLGLKGVIAQAKILKKCQFDAVISIFSTARTGIAVFLAGIPDRTAPATKICQIFHNHRLPQRRSKSLKPEYEYNIDLIKYFLEKNNIKVHAAPKPPFLHFNKDEREKLKNSFCRRNQISQNNKLIFIHPGSGGSASNLSIANYGKLASSLKSKNGHTFIITAGPEEKDIAEELLKILPQDRAIIYHSTVGIETFSRHIQFSDLFISGSTGPLHIAGALNCATAAFYPRRRSATALRWQTINAPEKRLVFSPPDSAEPEDLNSIDPEQAAKSISNKFL
jgi:ADP-heptose:LPS heptosyltransferase